MASSQPHPVTSGRAAMHNSLELTMEQCVREQYLARIEHTSDPEQQIPEPDPKPRQDSRLMAIEVAQAKILNQLKKNFAAPKQAPATISAKPATQTRTSDLREEASSLLASAASTPATEASYQSLDPRHERESPPPPPTKAELLAGLQSELQRRQNICLGIERQLEACQREVRTHIPKQKKIEKEHEKRIVEFMKPEYDEKQKRVDVEKRKDAQTAEEAEFWEMRDIYLQYDRESTGVPNAESVDAFFGIIADTEHHLKMAEEANKDAKRREVELEEKLYRGRCAMFVIEDEIEELENGGLTKKVRDAEVGETRIEGHKEGKRRPKPGKGVKDRQEGKGEDGVETVGRRGKRRRNISSKAGKMSSDTALNS